MIISRDIDAVAVGKAALANKNWSAKAAKGDSMNEFVGRFFCSRCKNKGLSFRSAILLEWEISKLL